jgi:hypothetical protein
MNHEGPLDLVREHPEIIIELIRGRPGIKLGVKPKARQGGGGP